MKYLMTIVILLWGVAGCTSLQQHEKIIQEQAQQAGLVAIAKSRFDSAFVSPSENFRHYKKIIINDLDLSQVAIVEPNSRDAFAYPWTLTDEDKRYYQARFAESAKQSLLDSGLYTSATAGAADTLILRAKITEIAPRAAKDDGKSRPSIMNVYSEGFGRMTIAFELSDAETHKTVMLAADEHDLGSFWELNNRVQNNLRIRLAFDYWLHGLAKELSSVENPK